MEAHSNGDGVSTRRVNFAQQKFPIYIHNLSICRCKVWCPCDPVEKQSGAGKITPLGIALGIASHPNSLAGLQTEDGAGLRSLR